MPASGRPSPPSSSRCTTRRYPVDHPGEHGYPPWMTDAAKGAPAESGREALSRIRRLEVEQGTPSGRAAQAERELRSAKAEIEVKDEYVTSLEAELEATLAFLRDKTAYIESLPSVRLKAWMKSLVHRSK